MVMKGSFFLGNKTFSLEELELPPLGPLDVLVQNRICGICGTDIHIYHGEPGSADVNPPVVLGHEYSGVIKAVGSAVTALKEGDHVTIDPNIYCGECPSCRNGKKQLCTNMQAIGVTRNGGFAEYSVVPASQAYILDPQLDFSAGAMAEPLACCIHGIDLAGIKTGDSVLIIGGGAIGLIMVRLAKLSGASKIILSEPVEMRRKIAMTLGASGSFDPLKCDPAKAFEELTNKNGADIVIECVGNIKATEQAFECAASGATILLFSVPNVNATYELPLFDVFKKELTIKGSFVNPDTHARAVELLNTKMIVTDSLITHRFNLGQLEEAIMCQQGSESIKVVVEM